MMIDLLRFFADQNRSVKVFGLLSLDSLLIFFSILLAFAVRFTPAEWSLQIENSIIGIFELCLILIIMLASSGFYKPILRYAGTELLTQALRGVLFGAGAFAFIDLLTPKFLLPRSVLVMSVTFSFLNLIAMRLIIRWMVRIHLVENRGKVLSPAIIYGAGQAGIQLFDSMKANTPYKVVAFVDDDHRIQNRSIRGVSVFDPSNLKKLSRDYGIEVVLLALPRVTHQRRQEILQKLRSLRVQVQVLPTIDQLIKGEAKVESLQEVVVEDILGRDEVKSQHRLLEKNIKGLSVMVSGAGGSIGSEICREIIKHSPKRLILFELNEYALYKISQEFLEHPSIISCLGSVLDSDRITSLLLKYDVQTVYHAAAYKHVPLVEANPIEGLRNNVVGTKNMIDSCSQSNVSTFVLISTDKAVRPTNIMGASKRIAELLTQDAARKHSHTNWSMVRFGNVLDSSGSVVPLFREQIRKRLPVTVTHPEITRYFMSIGEAARLVIQAGALAEGGEVFLLDMGQPIRIKDLAVQMIELSGLLPEEDIPIRYTGLRPGEKLYEELLIDPTYAQATEHPRIFCSEEPLPEEPYFESLVESLLSALDASDLDATLGAMRLLVPEYHRPELSLKTITPESKLLN